MTNLDTGGSDWEGEAQSPDEPILPSLGLWDCVGDLACPPLPTGTTSDIASSSVKVAVPSSGGENLLLPSEKVQKSSKKGPLGPKRLMKRSFSSSSMEEPPQNFYFKPPKKVSTGGEEPPPRGGGPPEGDTPIRT